MKNEKKKSKKKWIIIAIIIVLAIIGIASCGGDDESGTVSNNESSKDSSNKKSDNTDKLKDSDFEVTEYRYGEGNDNTYILKVQNNSKKTVDIEAEVTALDEKGESLSVASNDIYTLEPGKASVMEFYFNDGTPAKFEYNIDYSKSSYESKVSNLDISETQNNKNVVIKCTNTSDDPVEFPQVSILFFKGDTLVEYDMGYLLPDSDDELKPGKSKSIELECYEDFDRYETFYTAR